MVKMSVCLLSRVVEVVVVVVVVMVVVGWKP